MVAINSKAKPDTVLLLDFAAGNDEVDYSQFRTNLTNNTTYLEETGSARTALAAPRTIEVSLDVQTGETGTIIEHGTGVGSAYGYRIQISGDAVLCQEDGSTVVTAAIPGLTASDRQISITWAQFEDGSNVRSELTIYNHATAAYATAQATHTPFAPDSGQDFAVGARPGGGDAFAGGLDFYFVRVGRRYHSGAEHREDWRSLTSAPSTTQTLRRPVLVPDRATFTDLAADGTFVGPEYLWAGHAFVESDRRLVGSLVNHRVQNPIAIDHGYDMPTTSWWRAAPGDESVHLCLAYLWCCPVPLKVNRANVRLHVALNNPADTSAATTTFYAYSLAGLPVAGAPVKPLIYRRTAAGTRATDDGTTANAGAWVDLGALPLAVDDLGHTWIAIGLKFDEASPYVADTVAYIRAVTVDPYFEPAEDTGLDFEGA